MNNIFVLNKNYSKIGTLSNQGANPQAPYFNDLFVQELETGADTYQFSTISSKYTQDLLEIGNHIMFAYRGRNELFTITSLEYSHNEGYKTIGVYAEGLSFELLEVFMERPKDKDGNSSSGGNDSDGDGDDNTDDEYADPDDVYIDENGNIIYDKNGGNKPSADDVTIDGNGNIIYKRSKNNKKNDSLEFKNISYPTFLNIILKGTGWTYVAQPGLESVKHNISVKYDRNIYAVLQDSMQSYRGVELEFVYEYNNGSVKKIVKAYKDGGRGSFIGKRFEYGVNVRGITKMQEVANSEDDTVLRIDNVGIDVTYDVDFALKSAEVPEIEIGDTHYVIDKDFYPPMTITARIGKIEVSFSDPTRNKIYLANNKRISGSAIEDELDEDSIKDIIDDHDDDGATYDHYHDRLIDKDTVLQLHGYSEEDGWFFPAVTIDYTLDDSTPVSENIFTDHQALISAYPGYHIGSEDCPWGHLYAYSSYCDETVSEEIRGSHLEAGAFYHLAGDSVMENMTSISDSSDITKQDMYDFIINKVNLYSYDFANNYDYRYEKFGKYTRINNMIGVSSKELRETEIGRKWLCTRNHSYNPDGDALSILDYSCNLSNMIYMLLGAFQQHVAGSGGTGDSGSGSTPGTGGGTITDGFDVVSGNELFVGKIDAEAIEAAQVEVTNRLFAKDIVATSISKMTTAEIGAIETGIIDIVVKAKVKEIEFYDGSTLTTANGSGGGSTPSNPGTGGGTIEGIPDGVFEYIQQENSMQWYGSEWLDINRTVHIDDNNLIVDGSLVVLGALEQIDYLYAREADITTLRVNGVNVTSDRSLKENIRYIDAAPTTDDLEKADLYDFIVNQVNICEYNYIGDTADKIGLIANDYEGTKVGDKIVTRNEKTDLLTYDSNNLLFATIGALQEEVRIKDEKIASLEDRLAKIEAMLGINNDN